VLQISCSSSVMTRPIRATEAARYNGGNHYGKVN
jgi:hypothetical protein